RTIAATEVQRLDRRHDPQRPYQHFTGFAHKGGNRRKVAFLPQCFVRIHTPASLWLSTSGHATIVKNYRPISHAPASAVLAQSSRTVRLICRASGKLGGSSRGNQIQ